jgi:hypothetical protein
MSFSLAGEEEQNEKSKKSENDSPEKPIIDIEFNCKINIYNKIAGQ